MKKEKNIIKNIRSNILKKTFDAQTSHIGSCLSIVEILYVIYFLKLKKKDTFILSKGHAALALYSTLCEKKILSRKILDTYGKNNSNLMSHVSHKVKGVEFSTGSLGHGLPYAVGKALDATRKRKCPVLIHAKVPLLNHHTSGVRMEWYRDDLEEHQKRDMHTV